MRLLVALLVAQTVFSPLVSYSYEKHQSVNFDSMSLSQKRAYIVQLRSDVDLKWEGRF